MKKRRRALARLLVALAFLLPVFPAAAVERGPHGQLTGATGNGCLACHLTAKPDGLDAPRLPRVEIPPGGKTRLLNRDARFCWLCHRAGNPYGARPLANRALSSPAHGVLPGVATVPDAWALGRPVVDPYRSSGIEKAGVGYISCPTCHDVHDRSAPLYLRKSTAAGDFSALCAACHPDRDNDGFTGRRNILVRERVPYSTHPTSPAGSGAASGAGPVRCQECHDVHRAPLPGEEPVPGLLRGKPGDDPADLCRACHAVAPKGDREAHPMEAPGPGRIPPGDFASKAGIPSAWDAGQHFDAGATPFLNLTGTAVQGLRCTSCHDLHGGLPATSLLYAPDVGRREEGDWCFSCHPRESLLRLGHAGDGGPAAGADCGRCHGGGRGDARARWGAHRGFRVVRAAPTTDGPAAATTAGMGDEVVLALIDALRDRESRVRENALEVLSRLRPAIDPALLAPAARDPHPEARAAAAQVLGALGDGRGFEILQPLCADPEPRVRAAAAAALAGVRHPGIPAALLALVRDPAAEVRAVAMPGFLAHPDPRAIPPLLEILHGPDRQLHEQALYVLSRLNDRRALAGVLARDEPDLSNVMEVLRRMSDPEALADILPLLEHWHRLVRRSAVQALERYREPEALRGLGRALQDADGPVRVTAATILARRREAAATALLIGALRDPGSPRRVKLVVLEGLVGIGDRSVVIPLVDALADPEPTVRDEANAGLYRLTCVNFGPDQARWRSWWEAQPPDFTLGRCRR